MYVRSAADPQTGACVDAYVTAGIDAFRSLNEDASGGSAPILLDGIGFLAVAHTRVRVGSRRLSLRWMTYSRKSVTTS